jgi:glycosyltransferase involved in cell wall biosynthesis
VTVGAFPGYLEGFGFGVLEKLAAALPTVTYAAPGPREMIGRQVNPTMVPPGDAAGFADLLVELLTLPPERYAERSAESARVAARFAWKEIAGATCAAYHERWERLRQSREARVA